MSRCRNCGRYSDVFEWPEDERENYKPGLCYSCYKESLNESEEDSEDDPESEFGITDPVVDPEFDDTPNLEENEQEESEVVDDEKSDIVSDEEQSIQNIKRLLFG